MGGMAKGRKKNGQFTKGGGRSKARRASTTKATSITVRAAPAVARVRRAPVKRRRSGGSSALGSVGNFLGGRGGHRTAIVVGSLALGFASKKGWLAKLPVVGKAGPITSFGLLGWGAEEFLKIKLPPIVQDMITSSLALSAFNIGFSGGETIVGDAYQMPGGAVFFD